MGASLGFLQSKTISIRAVSHKKSYPKTRIWNPNSLSIARTKIQTESNPNKLFCYSAKLLEQKCLKEQECVTSLTVMLALELPT